MHRLDSQFASPPVSSREALFRSRHSTSEHRWPDRQTSRPVERGELARLSRWASNKSTRSVPRQLDERPIPPRDEFLACRTRAESYPAQSRSGCTMVIPTIPSAIGSSAVDTLRAGEDAKPRPEGMRLFTRNRTTRSSWKRSPGQIEQEPGTLPFSCSMEITVG